MSTTERKMIPVRMPVETHKAFMKRLIDDEMSAQAFFLSKVQEYLGIDEAKGKEKDE